MEQLEADYARVQALKEEYELQQNKKSKEQGRSLELEDSQVSFLFYRLVAQQSSHTSARSEVIASNIQNIMTKHDD